MHLLPLQRLLESQLNNQLAIYYVFYILLDFCCLIIPGRSGSEGLGYCGSKFLYRLHYLPKFDF